MCHKCDICNYTTNLKKNYDKHLTTNKHILNTKKTEEEMKIENDTKIICDICNKGFFTNAGLWKHKKKCKNENKNLLQTVDNLVKTNTKLMEHNNELVNKVIELSTELSKKTQITNNNNTIVNNNTINIFLNEACKDAINMSDFINNLKITLDNLIKIGDIGYTEAMSDMIITELQKYKITERPIHCIIKTQFEKITHIKDNDMWKKDLFSTSEDVFPIANEIDKITKDEFKNEYKRMEIDKSQPIFKIKLKNIYNNLKNNNTGHKKKVMENVFNSVELKNDEIKKYIENL